MNLDILRHANRVRDQELDPEGKSDLTYRALELGGEVGEALNIVKKLERERRGLRGSRSTNKALADELADVVIAADLTAMKAGIDLSQAVVEKFNATSEQVGASVFITHSGDFDA